MLKHLGTYLAHYAAVVAGAAAYVAGHASALAPVLALSPHATVTVATVVGVSSAVVALFHALGVDPPAQISAWLLVPLAAVLLSTGGLSGCASVQSWLASPTGQAVVDAGVGVAVTTAESKGITAAQINSVAKAVLAADQGATVTVATLTQALNVKLVALKIPAGDIAAFQGLELAFDAWLVAKYGSNSTVQNLQADVATFCNQVIALTQSTASANGPSFDLQAADMGALASR